MKPGFNPWPYGIIAFFVLLLSGMATVVGIALTHRESMVSDSYYEKELVFQQQIDSTARAQQAGASIRMDAASGRLLLAVPAEQVAQAFSGAIELYRPSSPDLDRQLPFTPGADGVQTVDLTKLARGLWEVHVNWTAGGKQYYLEQKLAI
jgi:nitrogen fixation protein FixH